MPVIRNKLLKTIIIIFFFIEMFLKIGFSGWKKCQIPGVLMGICALLAWADVTETAGERGATEEERPAWLKCRQNGNTRS